MTEHHWFGEHLVEFATEQLSAEDTRLVEEHLTQCETCRAEVAAIRDDLRYLPMGAVPVPPRPGFNARALRAATGRSSDRRAITPWLISALAASTVLAAGLAWQGRQSAASAVATAANLRTELAASQASFAALTDTLSIVRKAGTMVYTALAMPGQRGGVVLFADASTHRWQLVAHGLPLLPAGQHYQFWFVGDGGMARGVQLTRTEVGSASLTTGMPETPPGRITGAAITIESDQSAPSPEGHGPKIATLLL